MVADRIGEIIEEINEYFMVTEGVGVELHPDNVTVETLGKLKAACVTKISIGIQSFSEKFQTVLGRKPVDPAKLKEAVDKVAFETVSTDFIFALPNQTYEEVKSNVDVAFRNGANHVAIYPFYYHYYEQFYTLSYIDKMWGIMRNEAFPKYIKM